MNSKIGFVVNYYFGPAFPQHVRYSAFLALQLLRSCDAVCDIVLVDGSPVQDALMKSFCGENKLTYLHAGRGLSFAQGYNLGWKRLKASYIGLMASDIFPSSIVIDELLKIISLPDVGMVSPYLDYCDYPGQISSFVRKPITCEPSSISLNLNIFKRTTLESVNGIDENFSGGYNDLILLMKIRQMGLRVVLVGNTRVAHIGRITVANGTQFVKKQDDIQFTKEYPQFRAKRGKWNIKHWSWPFATSFWVSFFWWCAQNFPFKGLRRYLEWVTIWLEPELTRYPSRYGRLDE